MAGTADPLPPVLRAIVDSKRAWLAEVEIAHALNSDDEAAGEEIERLIDRQYVDRHMMADGAVVVTFGAVGAGLFGYELDERGRWSLAEPYHRPKRKRRCDNEDGDPIARAVDPRPGPLEQLILREDDVARPIVILMGHALWPWAEASTKGDRRPETSCRECSFTRKKRKTLKAACDRCGRNMRRRPKPDACPGCKGKPLSKWTYCLRCGRWGWDEYFHPLRAQRRA